MTEQFRLKKTQRTASKLHSRMYLNSPRTSRTPINLILSTKRKRKSKRTTRALEMKMSL